MFLILCCADIYWPFVVGEWPPGDIWQELTPSTLHAAIDQAAAQSGIQINYTSGRPAGAGAGEQWAMIGYLDIGSRAQYKCKYIKHAAAREQGTLTKIVMGPRQYCCSHRTQRRITDNPGPWLMIGGSLNSVKRLNFNKINMQNNSATGQRCARNVQILKLCRRIASVERAWSAARRLASSSPLNCCYS